MNPYLQLHVHLGCCGKAAMDYAIKDESIKLPCGLRAALQSATSEDRFWHCGVCASSKSKRPSDPPTRTEPRDFSPEAVGRKWFFDTKYIKTISKEGKHYVIGFECPASGYAFTYNVETKDEIYIVMEYFCNSLINGTVFSNINFDNMKTVIMVSDQAKEFMSADFNKIQENINLCNFTLQLTSTLTWVRLKASGTSRKAWYAVCLEFHRICQRPLGRLRGIMPLGLTIAWHRRTLENRGHLHWRAQPTKL